MSEPLRRCGLCGLPAYKTDPCPRVYLHAPAAYLRWEL